MAEHGLIKAVAALAVTATGPFTPEELLQRLADVAAEHLGVDGVGVMIVEGETSRFVHSSGGDVALVEGLQELLQAGPCKSAVLEQAEVLIDDLAVCADSDWEPYVTAAVSVGLRATAALPLVSRGRSWGVLDLYRSRPMSWDDELLEAARLLADVAVSYIVMAHDRDEAALAQSELSHRATHDALTGLPNRVLAFDRLEHALASAIRHDRRVAVFFIDLDGFKAVNDSFGHEAGDLVLAEVAARMTAAVRISDTVARLGGDEFLVICEDLDGGDTVELYGEIEVISGHLEAALERPIPFGEEQLVVRASIGVAVATDAARPDDVVAAADSSMYQAKRLRQKQLTAGPDGPVAG